MPAELVDRLAIRPEVEATFPGALRNSHYGWLKRRLMRSIARRAGGDTDTSHDDVSTDWDEVDRFVEDVRRVTDGLAGRGAPLPFVSPSPRVRAAQGAGTRAEEEEA